MKPLANSHQLILGLLCFCFGVGLGSWYQLSITLGLILFGLWLTIYLSGQNPLTETIALGTFSLLGGFVLWQVTGGESWLSLPGLAKITNWLIIGRDGIIDKVFHSLPEPHGSLLTGIIFGNRIKIDHDLLENFRIIGLSHIIAVSGYNLSVIVANIRSLFERYLEQNVIWLCLGAIGLFVLITGAPASILRAAVMASVILTARYVGRPTQPIILLLLAASVLIIFEPKILFDIGFQLSLAATYAVMRVAPLITYSMRQIRISSGIKQALAETLSATVVTSPLIIGYFDRFSPLSPIANLLVVPLIPIIMAVGVIGAGVSFISNVLGTNILITTWPLLSWVIVVAKVGTSSRFSSLSVEVPMLLIWILISGIVIATEYLTQQKANRQKQELDVQEI